MSAKQFVQRLGMEVPKGSEGPVKKVVRTTYLPNFMQKTVKATVFMECGHSYEVTVDDSTNKFKKQYPCQKCR